ncbi:MAG: hypothetical protein K9N07_10655 [Candidatus Cloacimonetes bacterium]|nr:hypothetical protein [Candidatus Cloacimonadota bacterium]MCF8306308.1 hypothetical protein [Ignavibacteriales bacterium]MCF8316029.1 hypothetical protein [Ignavibacteriales bacterium]MCF8437623.1 hypothetical protein [Ignavibacteriales bacterium]
MKTIIIFTRGTDDSEFNHWYVQGKTKIVEIATDTCEKPNVYIAKYNQSQFDPQSPGNNIIRQLIIARAYNDFHDDVKKYFKDKEFENALILYHNQSEGFLQYIKSLKALKYQKYSSTENINIPPKKINTSSYPLDKLLNSIQMESVCDFTVEFDEVWNSFMGTLKLSATLEFLHKCLGKEIDRLVLTGAGINLDYEVNENRSIVLLISEFQKGFDISALKELRDALLEIAIRINK